MLPSQTHTHPAFSDIHSVLPLTPAASVSMQESDSSQWILSFSGCPAAYHAPPVPAQAAVALPSTLPAAPAALQSASVTSVPLFQVRLPAVPVRQAATGFVQVRVVAFPALCNVVLPRAPYPRSSGIAPLLVVKPPSLSLLHLPSRHVSDNPQASARHL